MKNGARGGSNSPQKNKSKRGSKRAEIQRIATQVVYRNGFRATTLADVAKAADVPLGSIYYYFKTKTDLGEAIVSYLRSQAHAMLDSWGGQDTPRERLIRFTSMTKAAREELVLYGCPIGSLCAEFGKDFPELLGQAGSIYGLVIDWMEEQFSQISTEHDARRNACQLMASLEGIALVAQGLGDAEVVVAETTRLTEWIASI